MSAWRIARTCCLGIGFGVEAFGDIVHCRSGSLLDLSLQSIIFLKAWFLGQVIDLTGQFACQLPCLNIFKVLDLHAFLGSSVPGSGFPVLNL